jgi:hypothetical protein
MHSLRDEIAATAAQMIAEEGLDYGSAKRKAYTRITGGHRSRISQESLPSNEQVEAAVREYLAVFCADHQPARLQTLRSHALSLMRRLAAYHPLLLGAVANGTATEFSGIHLACFSDNPKALMLLLLDHGMSPEAVMVPHPSGHGEVEGLAFDWQGESVVVSLLATPGLPKRLGAVSADALTALLAEAGSMAGTLSGDLSPAAGSPW